MVQNQVTSDTTDNMETLEMFSQGETVNFCAYCNTITWQEIYADIKGNKMFICRSCNMETKQLVLDHPTQK